MLLLFHVMTFVHGSCEFVLFKEKNKSIWSQFLSLKGPTKKNLANLATFLKYLIKKNISTSILSFSLPQSKPIMVSNQIDDMKSSIIVAKKAIFFFRIERQEWFVF